MRAVVVVLIVALCVLHHDVWWWNTAEPLALGFVPIGLAWHAGISFAAGFAWWLATKHCWPRHLDEHDEDG